ncbi:MAG: hypothetical protein M3O30_01650 [Planctomycetota bacterium]|nr:hypothetical protein [Planctomycetota bacterium]
MVNATRQNLLTGLGTLVNADIAERLIAEYDEILRRFASGDHRPAELSGGRFAEAGFRICQAACQLVMTPLGRQLPRTDQLCAQLENVVSQKSDESFRIHIPRALRTIFDFRNKRDVAHLGSGVSPNFADSSLIVGVAGWVLAEFVRITFKCSPPEAQLIVDSLADRRIPLIWQQDNIIRVLNPAMSFRERTLVVLYHLDPAHPPDTQLFQAVEYSNITQYRTNILQPLHKEAKVDYRNRSLILLPPGKREVESVILPTQAI